MARVGNRLPGLGLLSDPVAFNEALDVSGRDAEALLDQLRTMWLIRKAEEKIGDGVTSGKVKCPCHLGIGQEAVAVGVSQHLRKSDRVFGAHRSHSHFLALGADVESLFAEVLGKVTGASRGMGGSMHLYGPEHGFLGSVPIVAGTVPIAVGSALAAKMDGAGDVAVAYFGDGAMEEGGVHESLNLASIQGLPIIFVVENNLFSSHMHIELRQPSDLVSRFATAHGIPAEVIDGNDVLAVSDAAQRAVTRARAGQGPSFLECVTYRWRGHVGPREDLDVGLKRSDELVAWKGRDPIRRLADGLQSAGMASDLVLSDLVEGVESLVESAWARAEVAPFPGIHALTDAVYYREERV